MKIALIIIAIIALGLAMDYSGLLWNGVIWTKREEIRREVFENTRSFNEGMAQELARYKLQYEQASTPDAQNAIAFVIRERFADYDATMLHSPGLQSFLVTIRGY